MAAKIHINFLCVNFLTIKSLYYIALILNCYCIVLYYTLIYAVKNTCCRTFCNMTIISFDTCKIELHFHKLFVQSILYNRLQSILCDGVLLTFILFKSTTTFIYIHYTYT